MEKSKNLKTLQSSKISPMELKDVIEITKYENNTYGIRIKGKLIIEADEGILLISNGDIITQCKTLHLNPFEHTSEKEIITIKEIFTKGLHNILTKPVELLKYVKDKLPISQKA